MPGSPTGNSSGLYSFGGGGGNFNRMPGTTRDGEGLLSGFRARLSKWRLPLPFKAPSFVDRTKPYFSGIKRFGISKVEHYWKDPFHTLLNLPWPRFIFIFFLTYVTLYMVFAFIFWAQTDKCIENLDGKYAHALWLSSRTASTLGFDEIKPKPECVFTNLTVMLQVICSSLVNFIMLGLVFARFSAPFKRASTIRFSTIAVCNRHPSGYWCLALRVANMRKHQILKPALRMVMTAADSITPSNYIFEHLKIDALSTQETNLELGFPGNVVHVITPESPLYNLSLLEMETRMMEVLVFVDGIDAMTSKNMSARHAYSTNEVRLNEQFLPLHLEMRGRTLGLDFSAFDMTAIASMEVLQEYNNEPGLASRPLAEVQSHLWHLRHQTFKRLTDRDYHGHGHGGAPGPAGSGNSMTQQHDRPGTSGAGGGAALYGGGAAPHVSASGQLGTSPSGGLPGGGASSAAPRTSAGGAAASDPWGGFGVSLQPGSKGGAPTAELNGLAAATGGGSGGGGGGGRQSFPISAYLGPPAAGPGPSTAGSYEALPGAAASGGYHDALEPPSPQSLGGWQQRGGDPAAQQLLQGWAASSSHVPQQIIEMLPTSTASVEPRHNGPAGGGGVAGGGSPWP